MENFINEEIVVKNEIYEAFKYDLICPICSKIFIETPIFYELSKCLLQKMY